MRKFNFHVHLDNENVEHLYRDNGFNVEVYQKNGKIVYISFDDETQTVSSSTVFLTCRLLGIDLPPAQLYNN